MHGARTAPRDRSCLEPVTAVPLATRQAVKNGLWGLAVGYRCARCGMRGLPRRFRCGSGSGIRCFGLESAFSGVDEPVSAVSASPRLRQPRTGEKGRFRPETADSASRFGPRAFCGDTRLLKLACGTPTVLGADTAFGKPPTHSQNLYGKRHQNPVALRPFQGFPDPYENR